MAKLFIKVKYRRHAARLHPLKISLDMEMYFQGILYLKFMSLQTMNGSYDKI